MVFCEQSKLISDKDIKIEFTGSHLGEKPFVEILTHKGNGGRNTKYPETFVSGHVRQDGNELEPGLTQLAEAAPAEDNKTVCRILCELGIGYQHKTVAMVG